MRKGLYHRYISVLIAGTGLLLWAPASGAAGAPRGKAIEFGSAGEVPATNSLNNLAPQAQGLGHFQPDLKNSDSARPAAPDTNFRYMLAPIRPQSVRNPKDTKKARDLLDRQKNWAFLSEEELMNGSNDKEGLSNTDKNSVKREEQDLMGLTPEERFYFSLLQSERDKTKKADQISSRRIGSERSDSFSEENTPEFLRPGEAELRSFLRAAELTGTGMEAGSVPGTTRSGRFGEPGAGLGPGFSPFGLDSRFDTGRSPLEKTATQKALLEEQRKIVGWPADLTPPTPQTSAEAMRELLNMPSTAPFQGLPAPIKSSTRDSVLSQNPVGAAPVQFGSIPSFLRPDAGSADRPVTPTFTPPALAPHAAPSFQLQPPSFIAPKRAF